MTRSITQEVVHDELSARVKIFVFAFRRPVGRLARDLADVEAFSGAEEHPLTPQLRLMRESPPLTPPSAAVVSTVVSIWGSDLFRTAGGRNLMHAMAAHGPIAAVEQVALGLVDPDPDYRWKETLNAFRAMMDSKPGVFLTRANKVLQRIADGVKRP